jgi:hypothetical protein
MSEIKHTPGPWKLVRQLGYNHVESTTSDRNFIVASCPLNSEEDHANANLIAAAPELLEALDKAWYFIENVTDEDPERTDKFFELRQLVRTAYAKVNGDY